MKNERTSEERSALTNEQGYFLITPLRPSTYTIRIEHTGFAAIEYSAMPLAIAQELTLDFELKPRRSARGGDRGRCRADSGHQLRAAGRER